MACLKLNEIALYELMHRHGVRTQSELAERTGITEAALNRLVRGHSSPVGRVLKAIAEEFGDASLDKLIYKEQTTNSTLSQELGGTGESGVARPQRSHTYSNARRINRTDRATVTR